MNAAAPTTSRFAVCPDRNGTIALIKAALKARSGKSWSVTGGKGTAYGWITIHSLPSRRVGYGYLSPEDKAELAALLGLETVHMQGHSVPASSEYYREALERAHGMPVTKIAQPYWD